MALRNTALRGMFTRAAFLLATQAGVREEERQLVAAVCRQHGRVSDLNSQKIKTAHQELDGPVVHSRVQASGAVRQAPFEFARDGCVQQVHAQQQEQVQVQVVVVIIARLAVRCVQTQNVFPSARHYKHFAAGVKRRIRQRAFIVGRVKTRHGRQCATSRPCRVFTRPTINARALHPICPLRYACVSSCCGWPKTAAAGPCSISSPSHMKTTWSASRRAWSRLCVTTTMV